MFSEQHYGEDLDDQYGKLFLHKDKQLVLLPQKKIAPRIFILPAFVVSPSSLYYNH